ncbi:surfeit locus 1 family protein [Paremcibacter congregatus]|uniref:SURF1-like protein n=2 Tax=Paremcibacter congregatus TaxID=2043170 RepID=A0A2G4YTG1_9PROT|nr:surfeit locus 1 family protein [Paremcibacter congregatus]QDE26581.1 SURF1 family protein [Paremcibacter congregatus]
MGFRGYHFRPRLWPTVMTIPMIIILCLLGNWQVERLAWKLDLIEKLESRYSLPSIKIPVNIEAPDDWLYRHVTVTGRFLHMREMPLYGAGPNGKPGYDLFTPLLQDDGNVVIINRGWVPEKLKEPASRPQTITNGEVTVTGVLRKSWKKERFAPDNDLVRNIWYYGDLNAMAKAQDLKNVFPMFVYADKAAEAGAYPMGGRTQLNIINNHLDYALTWYGLAVVLVIIFLIFHIRKAEPENDPF